MYPTDFTTLARLRNPNGTMISLIQGLDATGAPMNHYEVGFFDTLGTITPLGVFNRADAEREAYACAAEHAADNAYHSADPDTSLLIDYLGRVWREQGVHNPNEGTPAYHAEYVAAHPDGHLIHLSGQRYRLRA